MAKASFIKTHLEAVLYSAYNLDLLGIYWDTGKESGNYYLGFSV